MPTYTYKCQCGYTGDIVKPLANLNRNEFCLRCSEAMIRQISAPRVIGDYAGYNCPITGAWIEGRRAHEENLARHGKRVLEPGETDAYKRRLAEDDMALDRAVEATTEEFVHNLPVAKREALVKEIQSGVTADIVRQAA